MAAASAAAKGKESMIGRANYTIRYDLIDCWWRRRSKWKFNKHRNTHRHRSTHANATVKNLSLIPPNSTRNFHFIIVLMFSSFSWTEFQSIYFYVSLLFGFDCFASWDFISIHSFLSMACCQFEYFSHIQSDLMQAKRTDREWENSFEIQRASLLLNHPRF